MLPTSSQLTGSSTTNAEQKIYLAGLRDFIASLSFGQCRLTKSGSNLLLSRFNGRYLLINGELNDIPAGGVTLAPTSLTASTLYYIYAYMNSGTMTLEASTTGHSTDPTTGVEIKTGDATRTLVGMARPIAGPAWQDSATQRFVRSWFNEGGVSTVNTFTTDRSMTTSTVAEINSEIRCELLVWSGERVLSNVSGNHYNIASGNSNWTGIGIDSTTTFETGGQLTIASAPSGAIPISVSSHKTGLAEGYHYLTVLGKTSGGTATWTSAVGTGVALQASVIRG